MIVYVRAVSYAEAAELVQTETGPWVSIVDPGDDSPVADHCGMCLTLGFEDRVDPKHEMSPKEAHAKVLIQFLDLLHNNDVDVRLHIHCGMGVSRSGAVAEWTQRYRSIMPRDAFEDLNGQIRPNNLLMRLLDEASGVKRSLASQFGEIDE